MLQYFIFFLLLNFPAVPLPTLIFDSSVVLIAEVVAETFSDVRCPLALVPGSPLSPSHVLAAGSQITHLSMVKHLLKITKQNV
jgi:hypothetical protein